MERQRSALPASDRRKLLGALGAGTALLMLPALFRANGAGAGSGAGGPLRTVRPGCFTIASIGELPLFALRDGKPVGVEAELMQRIVARLGLELVIDVMEWSACLASVPSGRADCVGGNMAWTERRAQSMMLTDAVYYTAVFAMMAHDKPFTDRITIADLAGHRIGTVSGFSFAPDLRRVPGAREVKMYDSTDATVRDVIAGRLDFAFLDGPIIDYMIQQNIGWGLKQVPLAPDPAFPIIGQTQHTLWGLNPANPALFDAINQGIAWLQASGQVPTVLKRYGLTNPSYLNRPAQSPRLGVDRDARGRVIGRFAHPTTDFSAMFA